MLLGPVFSREVATTPRRSTIYTARSGYVFALWIIMVTAYLMLTGTQMVRNVGDLAHFGAALFQILARLQVALGLFFAAMLAASAVAQEKDRRTLVLLLLTNLTNSELVLGKLMASVLNVLVMLAAALPLFMLTALLGGVSFGQIALVFAVTLAGMLACGSLGSILALWREKTFQALAMTVLVLVLWLVAWEIVATGALGESWLGISCRDWAAGFSPWQATLEATRPHVTATAALGPLGTPVYLFLAVSVLGSILINGVAMAMVRVWNPSRQARLTQREEDTWRGKSIWSDKADGKDVVSGEANLVDSGEPARLGRTRRVWDNPIIWREIRTWAYGRRILVIRLAYLVLFGLAAASLYTTVGADAAVDVGAAALPLVSLCLLSLLLVNAQAVTSMTSERDGQALDLLLVTDLTPKEIVFGKLGGVFYNTKEMVALPMLLCGYLWVAGAIGLENLVYLVGGLAVLYVFVAVLGVHSGMVYGNSRSAIATSLGTFFFLFLGVATCMRMLVAFSGSFQIQLQPFLMFMIGGGVGLYVALGAKKPSAAIALAAFTCPVATFITITSFLKGDNLIVFVLTACTYGFTTAAMLVPAIYEFDVATGRATTEES